ncbi:MAG: AMP-binding protein, partial [Candidatus Dormibacteraeota bacterium]|nr:AMP-binding protein [Candidatus Dormibacteraeota bacterium]
MQGTLLDILEAGGSGDPALIVPEGPRFTYAQLREQVSITAERLAQLGLERPDRIATVFPNGAEAIVLFLAAAAVGTAAPLNPAYKEEEFSFYLSDVAARALIVPPGAAAPARAALPAGVALLEAHFEGHGQLV